MVKTIKATLIKPCIYTVTCRLSQNIQILRPLLTVPATTNVNGSWPHYYDHALTGTRILPGVQWTAITSVTSLLFSSRVVDLPARWRCICSKSVIIGLNFPTCVTLPGGLIAIFCLLISPIIGIYTDRQFFFMTSEALLTRGRVW